MRRIILALAMLVASSAQAGVAYRWQTTQTSDTIYKVDGYIEFAGDSWGSYMSPDDICSFGQCGDPDSTVLRFMFGVNNSAVYLDMQPRTGSVGPGASLSFILHVGNDAIWASNGQTSVALTATGNGFWEVAQYANDLEVGLDACAIPPKCFGAVGRWVPVPVSGTLALMGLGLLLVAQRR